MEAKRLNKFIADSGYCSRREADRLIAEGRVRVDGRVGVLGDQVQPGDRIELRLAQGSLGCRVEEVEGEETHGKENL